MTPEEETRHQIMASFCAGIPAVVAYHVRKGNVKMALRACQWLKKEIAAHADSIRTAALVLPRTSAGGVGTGTVSEDMGGRHADPTMTSIRHADSCARAVAAREVLW